MKGMLRIFQRIQKRRRNMTFRGLHYILHTPRKGAGDQLRATTSTRGSHMVQQCFLAALRGSRATFYFGISIPRFWLAAATAALIFWVADVANVLCLLASNDGSHVGTEQMLLLRWHTTKHGWIV